MNITQSVRERFEKFVIRGELGECWGWSRSKQPSGYGQISDGKIQMLAHRVSYELFIGPIPDGMFVCHHCDNKECTNPAHLFVGTQKDNCNDRDAKNRVQHGERHTDAKLTQDDVDNIRHLVGMGVPKEIIAKKYDIDQRHVTRLIKGQRWHRSWQEAMEYEESIENDHDWIRGGC